MKLAIFNSNETTDINSLKNITGMGEQETVFVVSEDKVYRYFGASDRGVTPNVGGGSWFPEVPYLPVFAVADNYDFSGNAATEKDFNTFITRHWNVGAYQPTEADLIQVAQVIGVEKTHRKFGIVPEIKKESNVIVTASRNYQSALTITKYMEVGSHKIDWGYEISRRSNQSRASVRVKAVGTTLGTVILQEVEPRHVLNNVYTSKSGFEQLDITTSEAITLSIEFKKLSGGGTISIKDSKLICSKIS